MSIFGWRLTNKKPEVESEKINALHKLLENESKARAKQEKDSKAAVKKLKIDLKEVKEREEEAKRKAKDNNKEQALAHLKAAERYENSMAQATGARKTQLQAIVDDRLEKAKNLGYDLKGSISATINSLL